MSSGEPASATTPPVTAAGALARFAAGLDWQALPEPVRAKLLDHLLDVLAVACGGAGEPEAVRLRAAHRRAAGGAGACTVVAGEAGLRLPPVDAALANTLAARLHTFDDTLEAGPVHPGSAVVMAALAAAEARGAALTAALEGALAGYELAVRLTEALGPQHYDAGFHGTGTCTAPAAALSAARALGLGAPAIAHAINLGAAAASGTRQHQIDGSMLHSALNAARAAAAGVQAALHAEAGLPGAAGQLDGRWGLLHMLAGGRAPPAPIRLDALAEDWGLARVGLKPYPTCRFTHGPLALLAGWIAAHGIRPEAVEALEIRTFAQSASVSDRLRWRDRAEAILSHQFAAAVMLLRGPPRLAELDVLAADPAVQRMAARVRVAVDPTLEHRGAGEWPHHLRLEWRGADGARRVLEGLSRVPPGGPEAPLDRAGLHAKARDLIEGALGPGSFAPVRELLARPEAASAGALLALFRHRPVAVPAEPPANAPAVGALP